MEVQSQQCLSAYPVNMRKVFDVVIGSNQLRFFLLFASQGIEGNPTVILSVVKYLWERQFVCETLTYGGDTSSQKL